MGPAYVIKVSFTTKLFYVSVFTIRNLNSVCYFDMYVNSLYIYVFFIGKEELSLSPGSFTLKDAERKMRKTKLNAEKTTSRECKIRRVQRKKPVFNLHYNSRNKRGIYL